MPAFSKYKQTVNNIFELIDRDKFDSLTEISSLLHSNNIDLNQLNTIYSLTLEGGRAKPEDFEKIVVNIVADCNDKELIRDKILSYFKDDLSQERIICFVEYL